MERRQFIALLGGAAALIPPQSALACPGSGGIVGTWSLISSTNTRADGTFVDRWGPNPRGILMMDPSGHFSQMITGSESRIFGSKSYSAFGTYELEPGKKTFTMRFEGCSISRIIGSAQKRIIVELTETELKYVNPVTAAGTSAEVVWKRLA